MSGKCVPLHSFQYKKTIMKRLFAVAALTLSLSASAQEVEWQMPVDSIEMETVEIDSTEIDTVFYDTDLAGNAFCDTKLERFFAKRWVQSTYIGLPLITAGLIEMGENRHFRSLRNGFMPTFHNELDNYIQYSPAALMLALKAAGVESRSSWKKMLAADAFSIGLVTAVTRVIKPLAKEERPDGSDRHSFPSGHTATAFMCATMLHKEYGYLSPWVGFGAYTVAAATGVMRMMNNKHWMSDILAGAGFGIMGTEFGYWLADLAFPSHEKSYDPRSIWFDDTDRNPSFFGTYAGFIVPLHHYNIGYGRTMRSSTGAAAGLEGAYFFNRHWGVGSRLGIFDVKYIADGEEWTENTTHSYTAKTGVYFHQNIYGRLFMESKALVGYTYYPDINSNVIAEHHGGGLGTTVGVGIGFRAKQHLDFSVNAEHEMFPSPSDEAKRLGALVLSGSASIHF